MSFTGASVRPTACIHSLIAPRRPSSTIQAKVRTRKLVQKGISTQRMSMFRVCACAVARR